MKHDLIADLLNQTSNDKRFILGICGAPGAGKSTLAASIVTEWNQQFPDTAILVPMDGYHFSNQKLVELDLLPLKGIPDTFDVESFIIKLKAIKNETQDQHFCPRFDRSIEASIDNAIAVLPNHHLIVVEGNYLLLDRDPWSQLKNIFDQTWFIETDEELILPRLLSRHAEGGRSKDEAKKKVDSTDLPNARLVAACARRADRILKAADLVFLIDSSSDTNKQNVNLCD